MISGLEIWPAALDVLSHEHDVRHALDRPEGGTTPSRRWPRRCLLRRLDGEVALAAVVDGEPVDVEGPGPTLGLRMTAFEVVRAVLGRRSMAQVRRLDWTGDPSPALASFFVFGPATDDLVE